MKLKIFGVLVIVSLTIVGFFFHRYRMAPSVDFPQLELTAINGEKVSLQKLEGTPLVINFYASWCGPCMQEMPSLAKLSLDTTIKVICITDESSEIIQRVADRFPSQILFLKMKGDRKNIGIYTIPTTYVINSKGVKILEKVGAEDWTSEKINQLLKH